MKPRKPKSKPNTINSTTKDMHLMTKQDTIYLTKESFVTRCSQVHNLTGMPTGKR